MAISDNTNYSLKGKQIKKIVEEIVGAKDAVSEEASLRASADNNLQTAIGEEAITRQNADSALQGSIDSIEEKIPAQATSSNQLADKAFVNSSVATNTANFVGTFNSLQELEAVQNPSNNDYGFVVSTDAQGNTLYNRYKYNGTAWAFEYSLNNSSFTASQWSAINSGVTTSSVSQIATNTTDIASLNTNKADKSTTYTKTEVDTALAGKQNTLSSTQLSAVNSGIDSTKVSQIATNATDIASLQTGKQDTLTAGANIQISNNTISATDTTYPNFTGTDGTTAGTAGLVPAPATADAGKYLKADGTWDTVQGGIPTNATFWGQSYDATNNRVTGAITTGDAVGRENTFMKASAMALGFYAGNATAAKMLLTPYGLSLSSLGIHDVLDPTLAQDAATKNYVDNLIPFSGYTNEVEKHANIGGHDISLITNGQTVTATIMFHAQNTIAAGEALLSYLPPASATFGTAIIGADGAGYRVRIHTSAPTNITLDSNSLTAVQWYSGQFTYRTNLEIPFGNIGSISSPANTVIARVHSSSVAPVSLYVFSDFTDELTIPSQYWTYDSATGAVTLLSTGYTYLAGEVSGWESGDKLVLYYEHSSGSTLLGTIGQAS